MAARPSAPRPELRFSCEGVQRRITYAIGPGREVTGLTTFRKQRDREVHEVERAQSVRVRALTRAVTRTTRTRAGERGR